MRSIVFVGLLASFAFLASCGNRTVTAGGQGTDVQSGPLDPYGDPRVYEGDPFAGYLAVHSLSVPGPEVVPDSVSVPVAGRWAVQVAACTSESAASRLLELASSETGLAGSVDREGQWWKVRLGGWASRQEAMDSLDLVKAAGYSDAWVVERLVGD
jgi:predicted small secreted protein